MKEGEPVTLDPGAVKNPNDLMTWYFNYTHIAEITGDLSKICTGDLCEDGEERFRNRLKLDQQTGSLTITNTRTTDSGLYEVQVSSSNRRHRRSISIKSFDVTVFGECNLDVQTVGRRKIKKHDIHLCILLS